MTKIVKVTAAMLPGSSSDVTIRVRWMLVDAEAVDTPSGKTDQAEFPDAGDRFHVSLTDEDSGQELARAEVFPRSYVMLDPPRARETLSTGPDGKPFTDWLPIDDRTKWAPVDTHDANLIAPAQPDLSKALGVGHLLRYSHPSEVRARITTLVRGRLDALRAGGNGRFGGMDNRELDTHAAVFAEAVQQAPFHPVELFGKLRRMLVDQAQARALGGAPKLPGWLRDALASVDRGVAVSDSALSKRLASLVHLMLEEDLRIAALDIAKEAEGMRNLMALRASQGGTLIDYWCDFDKSDDDKPTPACDPASQGKVCLASEAFGLGVDIVAPLTAAAQRWRIGVQHVPSGGDAYQDGSFTLRKSAGVRVQRTQTSTFPPPAPASLAASVDYQLVSAYAIDAGGTPDDQLEQIMALAKPVTGDGQLAIQIAWTDVASARDAVLDRAFNVYCAWDGETSGALQAWFDDPLRQDAPTLAQLRPFLVTRRYSYRRDIARAFTPERVAALKLLTEPPHEATSGMPDAIESGGEQVPYPTRNGSTALARFSMNLREILPDPAHAQLGVKWERRGGALPNSYTEANFWTVEQPRPGSNALPPERLPQRYRLWVTAVDIFEQESEPVAVFAREPGQDNETADDPAPIFVPRWRSPPPPPEEIKAAYNGTDSLDVTWKTGMLRPLGAAIEIPRLKLDAQVVVMRRPLREIVAPQSTLAMLSGANPVLQQAVAQLETEGWTHWREKTIKGPASPGVAWSADWPLAPADRGYEYRALIGHSVPEDQLRFVHRDTVQTVRYLVRSGSGDATRFDEAYWQIPDSGPGANFRSHPAFSPVGRSDAFTAMPQAGDLPAFGIRLSAAGLVPARPVLGVQGIDRDLALAKFIRLSGPSLPNGLSTAQDMMVKAALARLPEGSLGKDAAAMFARLLENQFVATDRGAGPITQHPVIGLRGAVLLRWSDSGNGIGHVPTVLYRVYTARGAASGPAHARVRCEGPDTFTLLTGGKSLRADRPAMILIDGASRWTGLATADQATVKVRGLAKNPETQRLPDAGAEYDCWIFDGHVASEVKPVLPPGAAEFEAALPVPGGHSETGTWWLAAVNCANEENWLRTDGTPALLALVLPETIVPLAPTRLEARAVKDFKSEAAQGAGYDHGRIWKLLPDELPRTGGQIFPRTIVTWDPGEFGAREQYILIERQFEDAQAALQASEVEDPSWGLLQGIESGPAGAPWNPDYLVLEAWLEGLAAPQPPAGHEPERPHYFFPTNVPGNTAAWHLKEADMLPPATQPWPGARSFADYFAVPPSGDEHAGLTRGGRRVRYRAFKMVDLRPGLPDPDPAAFDARYLVSEPSAWTAWALADWPPFKFGVTTTEVPRGRAALVQFQVTSDYATPAASSMFLQSVGDDELFFRVEIRRTLETAFGESPATTLVGEVLAIPMPGNRQPIPVPTADYSLERATPGAAVQADYSCTATLVVRREIDGTWTDTVLRMADTPQPFTVHVDATKQVEQAVTVQLRVLIG